MRGQSRPLVLNTLSHREPHSDIPPGQPRNGVGEDLLTTQPPPPSYRLGNGGPRQVVDIHSFLLSLPSLFIFIFVIMKIKLESLQTSNCQAGHLAVFSLLAKFSSDRKNSGPLEGGLQGLGKVGRKSRQSSPGLGRGSAGLHEAKSALGQEAEVQRPFPHLPLLAHSGTQGTPILSFPISKMEARLTSQVVMRV